MRDDSIVRLKLKKSTLALSRLLATVLVGVIIFGLGVGVGNGRISLGTGRLKSIAANKNLPADLNYLSAEEVYDVLRENYDGELSEESLQDHLKQGVARATGDPFTEYLNAEDSQEFDTQLSGKFEGIGAHLDKENDVIVIVAPIDGYPAQKAGLKPLDVIAEIDGQSAYDLTINEAVKRIRGPKGTTVKLKVVRDKKEELNFEITREEISIPSVKSEILEGNIGYIKISQFDENTTELSRKAAQDLKAANVSGIILDMRSNPGGLLTAAVNVSSLWLDKKTVLEEKRAGVVIETHRSKGTPYLKGIPTVVLIDKGSASASEIVAGALKDNKAATVVGTKSFGKGSVQDLIGLKNGGKLKVTIARWFTPNGKNIDKEGIEPDQFVELTAEDVTNNRDPQKDRALEILKK